MINCSRMFTLVNIRTPEIRAFWARAQNARQFGTRRSAARVGVWLPLAPLYVSAIATEPVPSDNPRMPRLPFGTGRGWLDWTIIILAAVALSVFVAWQFDVWFGFVPFVVILPLLWRRGGRSEE